MPYAGFFEGGVQEGQELGALMVVRGLDSNRWTIRSGKTNESETATGL